MTPAASAAAAAACSTRSRPPPRRSTSAAAPPREAIPRATPLTDPSSGSIESSFPGWASPSRPPPRTPPKAATPAAARAGPGGSVRLECEEHAGLFLSARRSPELDALLVGLPHSLLLEGRDGALSVLLPAVAAPRPALDRAASVSKTEQPPRTSPSSPRRRRRRSGRRASARTWSSTGGTRSGRETPSRGAAVTTCTRFTVATRRSPRLRCPSALYLALLRFLARRYANVCKLSDLCVSDNAPTPEEQQLWLAFAGVAMDPAPDACAARLRLSVAAFGTPAESLLPWDTQEELLSYVGSWRHVSASCRLSAREEQELLDSCDPEMVARSPLMSNRGSYLYLRANGSVAAAAGVEGAKSACPSRIPTRPSRARTTPWRTGARSRRASRARDRSAPSAGSNTRFRSTRRRR